MIRNILSKTYSLKHGFNSGCNRGFMTTSFQMGVQEDFSKAKDRLNTLKEEPGNDIKLKIYALFKQSTEGKCNKPKPGMMDFVGKAKWDAWDSLGSISKDDAMKEYINLINSLAGAESAEASAPSSDAGKAYDGFQITKENGVFTICLNRPAKKNAITWEMYQAWVDAFKEAAEDDSIKFAVVTGAGDFFCSGNDLSNFTKDLNKMTPQEMAVNGRNILFKFVDAFIDFPKPLIGLINGPAVGIAVSTLGLYDAVISSDHATFHMPFSQLGQTPEGCSSIIFPKVMGYAKACSLIMFNKKVTAQEMMDLGIVTDVIPQANFAAESKARVAEYAALPPQTIRYAKDLIRGLDRETLHKVNKMECDRLQERWPSDECVNAIMGFFSRKKGKL